ncbi:MAG: hypothetical protein M3Z08_16515 [Chloroflexota bacterium]|nr:hypothetical protein [Chloroflexota bacterium]
MSNEWGQGPNPGGGQPNQEDIDKRIEDIKRVLVSGASEAQQRIKRVVDKAGTYWQQSQAAPVPHQADGVEEQRIRQLVNMWSAGNWRVARDLGTYMELVALGSDEVWEVTVQTRWENRALEVVTEPYTGRAPDRLKPLLPVWDYELPPVIGLKPPMTRTRVEGLDEVLACTTCNSSGRALCAACTGRGWITCPDCRGRIKKRCATCRGRGYIADWADQKKKPFFQKRAENVANSVGEKVADVFDGIRQQGVPIPNPIDIDPANKGRTIPCPDCVNGEVDCDCITGKRICATCQGAKTMACTACSGTGKIVRHREMVRSFDLRSQSRIVGTSAIPEQYLFKADGEMIYNAELDEELYAEAIPDRVPADVWLVAVEMTQAARKAEKSSVDSMQFGSRSTLQVLELVRIPYTKVDYRFVEKDYSLFIYDGEGHEKFYAERFPARWERIESFVRAITADLTTTPQGSNPADATTQARGYRVPVEKPPYSITEDEDTL